MKNNYSLKLVNPKCSFCKQEIKSLYRIVEQKIECLDCYKWLNTLIEQKKRNNIVND